MTGCGAAGPSYADDWSGNDVVVVSQDAGRLVAVGIDTRAGTAQRLAELPWHGADGSVVPEGAVLRVDGAPILVVGDGTGGHAWSVDVAGSRLTDLGSLPAGRLATSREGTVAVVHQTGDSGFEIARREVPGLASAPAVPLSFVPTTADARCVAGTAGSSASVLTDPAGGGSRTVLAGASPTSVSCRLDRMAVTTADPTDPAMPAALVVIDGSGTPHERRHRLDVPDPRGVALLDESTALVDLVAPAGRVVAVVDTDRGSVLRQAPMPAGARVTTMTTVGTTGVVVTDGGVVLVPSTGPAQSVDVPGDPLTTIVAPDVLLGRS